MLREARDLQILLKGLPRSRKQINSLFESDCEIIKSHGRYLCSSIDTISEEINQGLYRDPFTWGWMTVMVSASDLAVSGSDPLGILLSTEWKPGSSQKQRLEFYRGVRAALKATGLKILGGDSGGGPAHTFSSTVLGESRKRPLTRMGVRPGDRIVLLGKRSLGCGPALALRYLFRTRESYFPEKFFRPNPRPLETRRLAKVAHASIDTSDGLAGALNIISQLNRVGFALEIPGDAFSPQALRFCELTKISELMLVLSDHGDFQSLFFVKPGKLKHAQRLCPDLLVLGTVQKSLNSTLKTRQGLIELPLEEAGNVGRDLPSIRRLAIRLSKRFSFHRLT